MSFGYVYFGEYSSYALSGTTFIDGLVLSTIGPGTFFETYTPDYIDLSGKFRLGKGNITYDGTVNGLSARGNIQNIRPVVSVSASAVQISSSNDLETSISNSIYEITPVGGSCVVTIFNSSVPIGEEFTVINTGVSGNIYFVMSPTSASINAVKNVTVLSGQWNQAALRKRQDFSWLLSLDK